MTQRERQILKWIEETPLISQQELADKAGIARSSVAVHISNLMKQGHIAGKGYIVRTAPYVVVVGGVNLDIGGRPHGELVAADSNPGQVRMSLGGVGRNIAHNMALMGLDVRMLTAFGDDMNAQRIAASCGELGIDISQCLTVPGGATSTYLFITDGHGDMALAVSDMEIYEHVTPAFLAGRARLLQNAQLLVVDTNIPAQSIAWLAENIRLPIFADPVSTAKAEKLRPVLGKLHTLKPNRIEAEGLLSGIMLDTRDFTLHTGVRTFEAAAALRRYGAETEHVRQLFDVSMVEYTTKAMLVSEAQMYRGCAITVSGEVAPEARVAIAQAANDLLTIQNVEASFVAVQVGGGVNISARSLGAVNVQVIMESLGGGGHQTMAAAQLKHITPEAARSRIQTAIDQYREAQKKSGLESGAEQKKKDKQ